MTATPLRLGRHGPIAHLVLDRPDKLNAITLAMWRALPGLMAEIDRDRDILAVLVRGEGDRAFSAGADIAEFETVYASPDSARTYNDAVRQGFAAVERASKPTVALIRGLCVGGGCGLALACDLRFASDDARFGITPSRLGLVYSLADTRRLVETVGPARARDMLFSGRLIDSREAHNIGLIDRLEPASRIEPALDDYLAGLAGASQYSLRAAKRMIQAALDGVEDDDPGLAALYDGAFGGEDLREGWRAFAEKRPPRFTWR